MADFIDASNYCLTYKPMLDKISGMVLDKSIFKIKTAKRMVQGFLLINVNKNCALIVTRLRRKKTENKINFSKINKTIVIYFGNMEKKFIHNAILIKKTDLCWNFLQTFCIYGSNFFFRNHG